MGSHRIVDVATGVDDPGVVAQLVRFPREVVGIDADAVSTDEAGAELEEVPLGTSGFEYFVRIDADAFEDDTELIDERDVDVALGVFDDFGGFGNLDARSPVGGE